MTSRNDNRPRIERPYPDFPLTPRVDGRWQKKIRGKVHYFTGNWQEALDQYMRDRDYLIAGIEPPPPPGVSDTFTVRDAANDFMTAKKKSMMAGDLKKRTWEEYRATCKRLVDLFRDRPVEMLRPDDFDRLRRNLEETMGPVRLKNEITRTRSVFLFAYRHGSITREPIYGDRFKPPSALVIRRERRKKGPRFFEPAQIHTLLGAAKVQMRAMILLGINSGLGNADCGQLEFQHLDLDAGWLHFPRPKTEIDRRAKLWPETVQAIAEVIEKRKAPKDESIKDHVFITQRGKSWFKETEDNPVAKEFRKLADATQVYRPGLTFYALRHTFETIAGNTGDQVATNYVMGHADHTMAGVYREAIFDHRLEAIADHVHRWLWADQVVVEEE